MSYSNENHAGSPNGLPNYGKVRLFEVPIRAGDARHKKIRLALNNATEPPQ
ncbi:MAG: hypothetical protein JWP59_4401 [Massilia sp.]|jgi:hypothetical protein|nr:hypothetical protein [Massilia sp.]